MDERMYGSSDEDDSSFDSDESFSSDEEDGLTQETSQAGMGLFQAFLNQLPPAHAAPTVSETRTPSQLWADYVENITSSRSAVLRITDACVTKYDLKPSASERITDQLCEAISAAKGLTHAILGNELLRILEDRQKRVLSIIFSRHPHSLIYVKLGSVSSSDNALNTGALFETLLNQDQKIQLNELEITGLQLNNNESVHALSQLILSTAETIRQVNLLSMDTCPMVSGCLDPLFQAAQKSSSLDELRVERIGDFSIKDIVSSHALESLLVTKKKWWRLGLCGLGLGDSHCEIMSRLFSRDETCKVGDLLALKNNPFIGQDGYQKIFRVFFDKQRMGLIKVDDLEWERKFDLVRSMNNLHGRLTYVKAGVYESRVQWIQWLAKLGNLSWEDDKHKLNYLWFTLLENPDLVYIS